MDIVALPVGDDDGCVHEPVVLTVWRAHDECYAAPETEVGQYAQRLVRGVEQMARAEEVLACIACYAQLGEYEQLHAFALGFLYQALYLLYIILYVGNACPWHCRGYCYESVVCHVFLYCFS